MPLPRPVLGLSGLPIAPLTTVPSFFAGTPRRRIDRVTPSLTPTTRSPSPMRMVLGLNSACTVHTSRYRARGRTIQARTAPVIMWACITSGRIWATSRRKRSTARGRLCMLGPVPAARGRLRGPPAGPHRRPRRRRPTRGGPGRLAGRRCRLRHSRSRYPPLDVVQDMEDPQASP